MEVYVIIKSGLHEHGDLTVVSTEKVFQDKAKAEAYMREKPTIWEENINNIKFYCERALHTANLE
jgi:hypothetical protein